MAKTNRDNVPRVNFFDGQKITEQDLDEEQIHHRSASSDIVKDFHGSGVVRDRLFESRILLDTSDPDAYSEDDENPSKFMLEDGSYDGAPVHLDVQPSDNVYGNRLEVEAKDIAAVGRLTSKVLIVGRAFNGIDDSGELVSEVIEFKEDGKKLTKYYYVKVLGVLFNNFSGGAGRTEGETYIESLDLSTETGGKIIFRESEPLSVYSNTMSVYQIESPNIDLANFITSDPDNDIQTEITTLLGADNSFADLYFELESDEQLTFPVDGDQTIAYGQKFLSNSDNLQRIDLLLSVEEDETAEIGREHNFSGDIVISVHELTTEVQCLTDPVPDNLIDFDPDLSPIMEVSYSQEDLEELGYKLTGEPQVVSFNFAGTLIADPEIDPSLEVDKYYALLVSRRGDNRTGTLVMEKGHDKASRKEDNGQDLNVVEKYAKQTTRFIEYDSSNRVYVDDSSASLWFIIYTDTVEVTDGTAYTDDGFIVTVPKTEEFVGGTQISKFERNISLKDVSEGSNNYIALTRFDNFVDPNTHPRTGNFIYTRIEDAPAVYVVSSDELDDFDENFPPILLARVTDNNVRDAQDIEGELDKPGMIASSEIIIIDPSSELLTSNLINRVITPDTDCECNSRYRIASVECEIIRVGDLDNDGEISSNDIIELLNVVGNTINSETTERKILGGELSLISFLQSDLNADDSVDGTDIELLEDAVDGYINFAAEETFNILRIKLENIHFDNDYPIIFEDTAVTGGVSTTDSEIFFVVDTECQALAIRVGDVIEIPSSSVDAGSYYITGKVVEDTGVDVTVAVVDEAGDEVEFSAASAFAVTVTSGTRVNTFADNMNLLNVPFEAKNYSISHIEAPFDSQFVDVCDLRRYVETAFTEIYEESCICAEDVCIEEDVCEPQYKTQKVLANDLFIPSGEIYSEPGVPYHGDIEYANITIPLPPGSIEDCSIDLYTNFIKSDSGKCVTASGYPAMTYSDGTYVGCDDSGASTDITKGRIKISQAIASLYVDALIDGYAVDGYADETDITTNIELIAEALFDYSYVFFSGWGPDSGNASASMLTITKDDDDPSTPQDRGIKFDFTTIEAESRFGRVNYPTDIDDMTGDFVLDFRASRANWEDTALSFGRLYFFSTVNIVNDDGTTAILKIGWRQRALESVEIFYSGEIYNATGSLISDFDFAADDVESPGDEVLFRLRRVNEVVTGLYFDPNVTDTTENPSGQYIRIGENPDMHPGDGSATVEFEVAQENTPNAGVNVTARLHEVIIQHSIESDSLADEDVAIGRDDSTSAIDRITATFPLNLTTRTNIIAATLKLTAASSISTEDKFNITPYDIMNADNLGSLFDYPLEQNDSFITTFVPGDVAAGEDIEIDVTSSAMYWASQTGHLPGYYKAILIDPSSDADSQMLLENTMTLEIEYEDITTGVIFKIGVSLDPDTGIASLKTKNILYDALNSENRTVLNFGVHLKRSGFKNNDVVVGIKDLARIGIGTCIEEDEFEDEELCFFVSGSTATGTFVDGPFPCNFHLP